MENKTIIIDGVEYVLMPKDKNEESEKTKPISKTGWERVVYDDVYYKLDDELIVGEVTDVCDSVDEQYFKVGNYFSSKELAENVLRAIKLWLNLNRFAAEIQTEKIDWNSGFSLKYGIFYNHIFGMLQIGKYDRIHEFNIYFDTKEHGEQAIEKFKDELLWYFTEFRNNMRF